MHGTPPLTLNHPQSMNNVSCNPKETMRQGVLNGITKAQSRGYCSELTKEDMDNLIEIILHHIKFEKAAPARGFYALHKSNTELYTRLKATSPDVTEKSRLGDHLEEATSDIDRDEPSHEQSLDADIDELIREVTSHGAIEEHIRITETKSYSSTTIINIVWQASVNRMERMDPPYLGRAIASSLTKFSSPNDRFNGLVRLSDAKLLKNGNIEVVAHAEHREDLERLHRTSAWHEVFERSLGPLPVQTYNVRMYNIRIGCMTFGESKEKAAIINALTDENFPVDCDNSIRNIIGNIDFEPLKPRRRGRKTRTLMVKFLFPEPANKAFRNGLWWQGTNYTCDIADPRYVLSRCRKCQHYGHWIEDCSAEPQCGYCAGRHQTQKCPSNPDPFSNKSGAPKLVNRKCVLCGGPHSSTDRGCLVQKKIKSKHGFPTAPLHLVAEPTFIEPSQHEIISGRSEDAHSRPRILPQPSDNIRNLEIARNAGLRQNASLGHKREAEGGLPWNASDRALKRVKQEYVDKEKPSSCEHSRVFYRQDEDNSPKARSEGGCKFIDKEEESPQGGSVYREDSMAAYRQPSSYIVHRSK